MLKLNITFFTSSRIKLTHLSYLAKQVKRDREICIRSFHQLTYHANYVEPRILDRDTLLKDSVKSAISQCKKSGMDKGMFIFLIEDTSVSIDALSDNGREVPGLDVKYWMKDMTFEQLNKKLKGKSRKASVRSDMILFNTDQSIYIHKHDIVNGAIVDKEDSSIETNLVFPWLDDKTFNKWFAPEGFRKPMSKLTIKETQKVDFRKKTFQKILNSFFKIRVLDDYYSQRNNTHIQLFKKKVIVLTGYSCSGKTTIAQYLLHHFHWQHFEASDFMRLEFYDRHGTHSDYKLEKFATNLLEHLPESIPNRICQEIETAADYRNVVITGFRAIEEWNKLFKSLDHVFDTKVIFIEAPLNIRAQRAKLRSRDEIDSKISIKKMALKDQAQTRMGLDKFKAVSSLIENTSTIKKLEKKVRDNIEIEKDSDTMLDRKNLKNSILDFLFEKYDSKEYFTTTEISKYIDHNKDNISRFFNQSFYPDFEITSKSKTNRYRLSNTGYSRAFLMKKK